MAVKEGRGEIFLLRKKYCEEKRQCLLPLSLFLKLGSQPHVFGG